MKNFNSEYVVHYYFPPADVTMMMTLYCLFTH
uniref:Uncharacterized protein n=1 Tax=Anguilla anguilla TaxID=7936 RepID=A0A0E9XUL3_ANGAN